MNFDGLKLNNYQESLHRLVERFVRSAHQDIAGLKQLLGEVEGRTDVEPIVLNTIVVNTPIP